MPLRVPPPQLSSLNVEPEPLLSDSNNLKSLFLFIISRYIYVFSFSLINTLFIAYGLADFSNFIVELQWAVLPALLLVAVFALFSPYNKFLEIFFYFYASIWNTITIFQAITFGTLFDVPSLHIMLNTTTTEASGFFSFFFSIKLLAIIFIIWTIPLFLLFILKKFPFSWKHKTKFAFLLISVMLLLLPIHALDGKKTFSSIIQGSSGLKPPNIDRNMRKTYWVFYATYIPKVMQLNEFITNPPQNVNAKIDGPQNVILVLLESGNRNQFSLYGYPRKTTPELEKIKELIVYKDVLSPKPVSWTSVPLVFTFADLKKPEDYITTMPDLFRAAGFKTHSFYGFEKVNKNHLIYNLLNRADTFNLSQEGSYDLGQYNKLLDILKENPNDKNFILMTTALMHAPYNRYYPKDFEEFTDKAPNLYENADNTRRNQYDTGVKYMDYLVANLIKELKSLKNTVIIVTTDHGEEVGSYSTHFTHSSKMNYPSLFEIPFLVFMTDDYKNQLPDLIFDTSRPYQNDKLIHSLIDIAKIETSLFIPEYSIFNKEYKEHQRYIFEEEYEIVKDRYTKAQ